MRDYKTYEDLNRAISNNKSESVIRLFWEKVQHGIAYDNKINELKSKYEELYPELDDNYDSIKYLEYSKVKEITKDILDEEGFPVIDEETGLTKTETITIPIFDDKYYKTNEVVTDVEKVGENVIVNTEDIQYENRELKDEYKDLPQRPTLELYLETELKEYNDPEVDWSKYIEFRKPMLLGRVLELADTKTEEAKYMLAGRKVSHEQIERYKSKYEQAKLSKDTGDYTIFELEADLKGIPVEDLVDLIITMGDNWNKELNKYIGMIEAVRIKMTEIISNISTLEELDDVINKLDMVSDLDKNATIDMIKEILSN